MTGGRQGQLVVGQLVGPSGPYDAHGEVLVDHDHGRAYSSVVVVVARFAAEERIGGGDGVECGLELVGEVPVDEAAEELPVSLGKARVAGPAPPAAFLDQFLTDTHCTIMPGIGDRQPAPTC
jgi:hypothetical protein